MSVSYGNGNGNGSRFPATISFVVGTAFNILVLLVICFGLMPKVDDSIRESARNREAINANREQLAAQHDDIKECRKELEGTLALTRRLNRLIDEAAAKTEKAEKAKAKEKNK